MAKLAREFGVSYSTATGFSNIVPASERYIEGVSYLLFDEHLSRLDRYEGVPEHYRRRDVMVWNIEQNRWINAIAYIVTRTDDPLKPPRGYFKEIIDSADKMGLSPVWIGRLEGLLKEAV